MIFIAFGIAIVLASIVVDNRIELLKKTATDRLSIGTEIVTAKAREQYSSGVTLLRALQGFFVADVEAPRDVFYSFIEASNFYREHPDFSNFLYVRRVSEEDKEDFLEEVRGDTSVVEQGYPSFNISPPGEREEYWPIVYSSPEVRELQLLGKDQKRELPSFQNISRARDLGNESFSPVISLDDEKKGVFIAMPLYTTPSVPPSIEEKHTSFAGSLVATLVLDDLFDRLLASEKLQQQSITVSMIGKGYERIPVFVSEVPDTFWNRLYGNVEIKKSMTFKSNKIDLIFTAPAIHQLSIEEAREPIILLILFLVAALFISIVILMSQKMKLIGDLRRRYAFLIKLSHQLRTPVANLRWKLEKNNVPYVNRKTQDFVMSNVMALNSIVNRILLYIDIDSTGQEEHKKAINIEILYNKVLTTLAETHDISRVERIGIKNIENTVIVHKKQTVLALSYIIENALLYSKADQKVIIEFIKGVNTLDIIIVDSGVGIPKDEQKDIFADFFRGSEASQTIDFGTGVSLFMAKEIIEKQGGSIRFISESGKGSTFIVTLPIGGRKSSII